MKLTTADARRLLPLPQIWHRLGIPGDPPPRDGKNARCPWPEHHNHADRDASFGIYGNGMRFKCFGCGAQGDAVELIAKWRGLPRPEAHKILMEWAGVASLRFDGVPCPSTAPRKMILPTTRRLSFAEREQLAQRRGLSAAAVSLGQALHCVRYAEVCGFPSWILTDAAGMIAEARRLDGEMYPEIGTLKPRKAHTLRGSSKSWPAGVAVLETSRRFTGSVLLVEGGPDYLAALHFAIERETMNVLPVALLGRNAGRAALDPRALHLLRGRRVRLFPHADADGGGLGAGHAWAAQLRRVGCQVDGFVFDGFTDAEGTPLKDLNDLVRLPPDQRDRIQNLLP